LIGLIKTIYNIYVYILPSVKNKFCLHAIVTILIIMSDMVALIIAPQVITSVFSDAPSVDRQATIFLGIVFLLSYLFSGIFKTTQIILQAQIASEVAVQSSKNLFFNLYNKSLAEFNELDLGEVSSSLGVKITRAVNEVVLPSLVVPANIILVASLVIYLMLYNPLETFTVFSLISAAYLIVIQTTKKRITYLRRVFPELQDNQIKSIFRFMYDQKNIRMNPIFPQSLDRFMSNETELRNSNALLNILSTIPRYIIETFAIIIILAAILLTLAASGTLNFGSSFFITFLIAAQKILPAVQHTYQNHTVMKAGHYFFEELRAIERSTGQIKKVVRKNFKETLHFQEIKLRTGDGRNELIQSGELVIPKSAITLIYGPSGCGKTSLLENIIGLSDDLQATFIADGRRSDLDNRLAFFFGRTYYVSQRISCPNVTISEFLNCDVKSGLVYSTLNDLQLCDPLDKSYVSKMIGENGSFLSGGELQRLNLAKALLSGSETLILDEPTSAVNTKSEARLLDILKNSNKTILMISHSDLFIKSVNNRYLISNGKIELEK
jgi:ATP-binding cassette, subfamily B, bacterial PglK